MEFECKRLQQRLDSLRSDKNKKIRSWTEHVTEFGNTIVIKFSNKSKPTRESQPLIPRTTESNAVLSSQNHESSDASHSAEEKTDTRESSRSTSTTESSSRKPIETKIFKPVSQYQIKRDRERKDAFKDRCATRSRSDLKYPNQRQTSSVSNSPPQAPQSVEIKRDDTGRGNDSLSDICLSPDVPVESPYADKNPYSCLQADSSTVSESDTLSLQNDSENEELYEAGAVGPPVESQESQNITTAHFAQAFRKALSHLVENPETNPFRNLMSCPSSDEHDEQHTAHSSPNDDKTEDPT